MGHHLCMDYVTHSAWHALLMGNGKMNAIKVMVVFVGGVYCSFCLYVMWVYYVRVILHNFY